MPAALYALLSAVRTFRARWLNREVSHSTLMRFQALYGPYSGEILF